MNSYYLEIRKIAIFLHAFLKVNGEKLHQKKIIVKFVHHTGNIMPLLVYRPRNFDQTHEREEFRNLCTLLMERYAAAPDEMCIFIGNYNIGDVELDGIIIKNEGVAIVEFKDYGGTITAVENGDWVSEEGGQKRVIKGGSGRKNPYLQAKINRSACRPILSESGAFEPKQVDRLVSMIVFHHPATIDNRISSHIKWLRVCDEKDFIDELDLIVSPNCDLGLDDYSRIIERLNLDSDWLCVRYSNVEVLKDMNVEGQDAPNAEGMEYFSNNNLTPAFEEQPIPDGKQSSDMTPVYQEDDSQTTFVSYMEKVFSALGISGRFEVFDVKNNPVPSWVESSQPTNEFLVAAACLEYKKKLERFLSRPVFERDGLIYWYDGEPLGKQFNSVQDYSIPEHVVRPTTAPSQNQLKTSTRLPSWLDHFIFEDLKGRWDADHERFESNLLSSPDDTLVYLGTYFPRSYADAFCIFDNLFSLERCHSHLEHKDSLRVLSVGCGTGGDIIGLMTALLRNFTHYNDISVYAIDGNSSALSILKSVFDRFCVATRCRAHLYVKQMVINSFSSEILSGLPNQEYDFIVSSKMIGEVISAGNGTKNNAYYDFGKCFLPLLAPTGLCLILDLTTKPDHSSLFYPQMMGMQVNRLMREETEFEILIPICCSQYGRECQDSHCFQQKEFSVSHSRKNGDKCRVAYRLIMRKSFKHNLGIDFHGKKMSVCEGAICPFTKDFDGEIDPYRLCGNVDTM